MAVVEEAAQPGGQVQLMARVAAVAAGGAVRLEHAGGVEAAQEGRLHPEQFGGLAHRERGEVRVVEPVGGVRAHRLVSPRWGRRGGRARPGTGPRRVGQLSTACCPADDDSPSMVRCSTAAGASALVTVILRARAFSATGMLSVRTPSW